MSLINDNSSSFKNFQDSSNTHNDIVVKLKRNKIYLDKENDECIVNFANRKRLTFKRFVVEQNIEKAKSSSSNNFYSFNQFAFVEKTFKKKQRY